MRIKPEKWLDFARYSLYLYGVANFLIVSNIVFLQKKGTLRINEGKETEFMFLLIFCGLGTLFSVVIARGLNKRKIWAWVGALIIGIIYLGTMCFPLGAVILYSLFKNKESFIHPKTE